MRRWTLKSINSFSRSERMPQNTVDFATTWIMNAKHGSSGLWASAQFSPLNFSSTFSWITTAWNWPSNESIMSSLHELVRSEKVFLLVYCGWCGLGRLWPGRTSLRQSMGADIFFPLFFVVVDSISSREIKTRWLHTCSNIIFNKLQCLQLSCWLQFYQIDGISKHATFEYCQQMEQSIFDKKRMQRNMNSNLNNLHANIIVALLPLLPRLSQVCSDWNGTCQTPMKCIQRKFRIQ